MNRDPSDIAIRNCLQADLPALAVLYAEAFNDARVGENWEQASALRLLEYWFRVQPDLFFVACFTGDLVGGSVAAIKPWWNGCLLVDGELFVSPAWQKQGIGRSLLRQLIGQARDRYDIVDFQTSTFQHKQFPLSWYLKIGFRLQDDLAHISADPIALLANLSR